MSLNKLTITKAADGLRKKQFSSLELTEAVFSQIKKTDEEIGAFLLLAEEEAQNQAKEIDKKLARGEKLGGIAGIPAAIKDNILVKGLKCTAGSKILENYLAPYDATVVSKLKEAGAVIIGKTNMDEFAMGSSTENSAFKKTKNPQDLSCVPGGSSGGSAAAVAANETIFALGSDTGGSIRQPAAFCGVVGLKPTYGAVSRFGLMAMASSLDQIGPLTKSVEDSQIVFDAIYGKDRLDSTSVASKFQNPADIGNLRIGLPKEYFAQGLEPEVEKSVRSAIEKFSDSGAKIKEISLPFSEYALACYYIIMPSEVSANLARYDGIKYGLSKERDNLLNVYLASRQEGFGDEVRRRVMLGTYTLSAGYYDAYYLKAQKVRTLIKRDFEKAFREVDLIMTPTSPTPAFKLGEKIEDPIKMYLSDIYTVPMNLAGLPALSLPCGRAVRGSGSAEPGGSSGGLPISLQIIGPQWSEPKIFSAALYFEKKFNGLTS
ncbi:MAG: aspartyl/glutamyl-tRNA amidotransferase subunit A [Candidatus Portnoybacteria bacterium RBG_19FT_COMBO_36_7]|uniref:Glutamyl-tRNA(Gln) amidotransferase subunit A n=1 Tax=Candidatus Portnoybacteria bacterium RBG_19FT_COMBO_36_7 TaxID=1801992 RepID=A0A1G2F6U0_9BACT|nr:MAG: aspartyl/glutamyl-tRNA amidotransferase subunit A [Candidatus Portnoybacteria bacterium RBG_19FT_COMBO_36_7]